jgi:ankyrin repeat protein
MAKALPSRPNLDWLRKTAKQVLRGMRTQRPEACLADAQLAVAREHGFSSWRALKTHVDQLLKPESTAGAPDDALVAQFLRDVRTGNNDAVRVSLAAAPALVNANGPHPHWGGRPQPLHMAIEGRNRAAFGLLLAAGADVNGNNLPYEGWSPLMLTEHNEQSDMRKELLKRGAAIGLAEALVSGDDVRLDKLLQRGKSAMAARAPGGGSWLSHARTTYAIDRLLELGAPIDKADVWETTPIEQMSRLGKRGLPLLRHLLKRGVVAKPQEFARLGDRETLESLIAADPSIARSDEVLIGAADFGHVELVKWLLEYGANPNARSSIGSQGTALHTAAWEGNLEMVKVLVTAGADITARDREHHGNPAEFARVAIEVTRNPACAAVAEYLEGLAGA